MEKKLTGYPSVDKRHLEGTSFFERNPIIPSISLSNTIDLINLLDKKAPAVNCLNLQVSHGEMKDDSIMLSKAFTEMGVKAGDIIAICTPNLYQPIACFKAANRIGATVTFLNSHASKQEIQRYLNWYESPILINYGKDEQYNNDIIRNTKVKQVITLDPQLVNQRQGNNINNGNVGYTDVLSYHDLDAVSKFYDGKYIKTNYGGSQDALILYTSGSTGNPKSLLFTNANVLAACIYYKHSARLPKVNDSNRKWMGVVPFMYPYGFIASILATFLCGREAIVCPDINADNVGYYYKKNPNIIYGSPAFLELTKRNLPKNQDLSSVQMFVSGGDYLSVSQSLEGIEYFKEHNANIQMCNCSGNGEASGCVTNAMNIEYRPETVGKLAIGPDFVMLDPETWKEVKYGEYGVLCTAGKHIFKGYYDDPEATESVMINFKGKKYYVTGNYGHLDDDSYFHMVGRASRFYIISTLNKVYCERIQKVISDIDIVDSCAVVPKKDDKMLWQGKAYVVLKKGIEESEQLEKYILEECRKPFGDSETKMADALEDYEVPASVSFLQYMPRTEADKIDYELLKEKAQEEYDSEKGYVKKLIKN